jgi:hypothetical protein
MFVVQFSVPRLRHCRETKRSRLFERAPTPDPNAAAEDLYVCLPQHESTVCADEVPCPPVNSAAPALMNISFQAALPAAANQIGVPQAEPDAYVVVLAPRNSTRTEISDLG